jgi:FeS assembly SUF system protein
MSEPKIATEPSEGSETAREVQPTPEAADAAAEAPQTGPPPVGPDGQIDVGQVRDGVIAVLKTVYDPEIPVDIYELGLIYEVDVEPTGDVSVVMTLTTPMCPVAETLPPEVEAKVRSVAGVRHVQLELVWEPPWSMDMMSEAARLELNL